MRTNRDVGLTELFRNAAQSKQYIWRHREFGRGGEATPGGGRGVFTYCTLWQCFDGVSAQISEDFTTCAGPRKIRLKCTGYSDVIWVFSSSEGERQSTNGLHDSHSMVAPRIEVPVPCTTMQARLSLASLLGGSASRHQTQVQDEICG